MIHLTPQIIQSKLANNFNQNIQLFILLTILVFVAHSIATLALGSTFKHASNIPSDIWSHNLSGWPSPTDSDAKYKCPGL